MKKLKFSITAIALTIAFSFAFILSSEANCVSCDGQLDTKRCTGSIVKTCDGDTSIFFPANCRGGLQNCPPTIE